MEFPGVGGYSVLQYAQRSSSHVCKEWLGYVLQATQVRTQTVYLVEDMVGMLLVVLF